MIKKCYLEITNICNMSCSFCHGTKRPPKSLTMEDFSYILDKLKGNIKYLYFHLLGEPLLHKDLGEFIKLTKESGILPIITTNGTLISERFNDLITNNPYKINISLHSLEANNINDYESYFDTLISFIKEISEKGTLINLRFWNEGGLNRNNETLLAKLKNAFNTEFIECYNGYKITKNIYIDIASKFDWPDIDGSEYDNKVFCYGMRDQIGILVDGTVVPCCLDAEGIINLGNIFDSSLDEIINSKRAKAIYDGFTNHTAVEALCKKCGYANETKKYRN